MMPNAQLCSFEYLAMVVLIEYTYQNHSTTFSYYLSVYFLNILLGSINLSDLTLEYISIIDPDKNTNQ